MPDDARMRSAMTTLDFVDPALRPMLALYPPLALRNETLPAVRLSSIERAASRQVPPTPATHTEVLAVPGLDGAPPVRVLAIRPAAPAAPLPALIHFHGGGFVFGTADAHASEHRELAIALGCAVFSVDYRLAPETRHPGPLDDGYAVLEWLHRESAALGLDRARIGLKGESAGGGIAASLAQMARDRGDHAIAFQHLIYPMLDDRTCIREPSPRGGQFVWTMADNRFGWSSLLGCEPGRATLPAYAAAARAAACERLPPTYLAIGDLDLFLDENLAFAARLERAGVPVELHVYPGAFHGFDGSPDAPVAIEARRDSLNALERSLSGQG